MQRITSLNVCGSITYISWARDSVLYLEDFLMEECFTEDIDSVRHLVWPIYRSLTYFSWYRTVILPYIFNIIWWTSLILWILVQCDMGHWHVFHDLSILIHLPISAYSRLLRFDMKIFVNVARLEIGQLFTQGARRGHPCTLDTFLGRHLKIFFFHFLYKKILKKGLPAYLP